MTTNVPSREFRVIDAHVHVFPPDMVNRREELLRQDAWFGEAFGHPQARMFGVKALIDSMDAAGIDHSIVVGWPWTSSATCREHNDFLADCAVRFPDRLAWLAIVNPAQSDAPAEIERCWSNGCAGFGEVNADGQGFSWTDPEAIRESMQALAERNATLMVHASDPVGHVYPGKGSATPDSLLTAISAFPDNRWVLAHWGGGLPYYELSKHVRALTTNVAYDSAASTYLYDFDVFPVLERIVGPQRMLFGSDWPVLAQGKFLARTVTSGISDEALPVVACNAAQQWYRLPSEWFV